MTFLWFTIRTNSFHSRKRSDLNMGALIMLGIGFIGGGIVGIVIAYLCNRSEDYDGEDDKGEW